MDVYTLLSLDNKEAQMLACVNLSAVNTLGLRMCCVYLDGCHAVGDMQKSERENC